MHKRDEATCNFGCGPTGEEYVTPGFEIVPACPVHGWVCTLLDAKDERIKAAQEALTQLRDAWNAHFARCQTPLIEGAPVPDIDLFRRISEWMNAPSNTASASISEHGEAVLPKVSGPPAGSVEALEAERDEEAVVGSRQWWRNYNRAKDPDKYATYKRLVAAEAGRDQAIKERDEARDTNVRLEGKLRTERRYSEQLAGALRENKATADRMIAHGFSMGFALDIANRSRSALAGVPGGGHGSGQEDIGTTADAVVSSEEPPDHWWHELHGLHDEAHHQHHSPLDLCVPLNTARPPKREAS